MTKKDAKLLHAAIEDLTKELNQGGKNPAQVQACIGACISIIAACLVDIATERDPVNEEEDKEAWE